MKDTRLIVCAEVVGVNKCWRGYMQVAIMVELEDGTFDDLSVYYSDEWYPTADEFIGMKVYHALNRVDNQRRALWPHASQHRNPESDADEEYEREQRRKSMSYRAPVTEVSDEESEEARLDFFKKFDFDSEPIMI